MDGTNEAGRGGRFENSPTFQSGVQPREVASPEGTADKEVGKGYKEVGRGYKEVGKGDLSRPFGTYGVAQTSPGLPGYRGFPIRRRERAGTACRLEVGDTVPIRNREKPALRKNGSADKGVRSAGFSLIEMLTVIAVIGILSSLIFPITKAVSRNRIKNRMRAELEQVATAIQIYQSKRGQYPPDNPYTYTNRSLGPLVLRNQLYYELVGTTNWSAGGQVHYQTSDGRVPVSSAIIQTALGPGVSGFANSRTGGSAEEGSTVVNCFKGTLRADQLANLPGGFTLLVGSVPLPPKLATIYPGSAGGYCAWRYNSSSPTNNPGSYDLWIDVIIDGRTNRFSNWSRNPGIVSSP